MTTYSGCPEGESLEVDFDGTEKESFMVGTRFGVSDARQIKGGRR